MSDRLGPPSSLNGKLRALDEIRGEVRGVAPYYADASALVKLVRDEPESPALRQALTGADVASCGLVLAEIPRAVRRAAALDARLDLDALLVQAGEVIEAIALVPVDRRAGPAPAIHDA